jgi:hypothetical protein
LVAWLATTGRGAAPGVSPGAITFLARILSPPHECFNGLSIRPDAGSPVSSEVGIGVSGARVDASAD